MSESFAELFEQSLNDINMEPGAIVAAQVVDIDGDWVTVNAGLKSEGQIPAAQFRDENGELTIAIGDDVHVALEAVEDGFGETRLSREKAKRAEAWKILEAAFEKDEIVKGVINGKVKGGFTVDVDSIRAFLPGMCSASRSCSLRSRWAPCPTPQTGISAEEPNSTMTNGTAMRSAGETCSGALKLWP